MTRYFRDALVALTALILAPLAHAQSAEDVGDADSYNRAVVHLGLAETGWLKSAATCPSTPVGGSLCVVLVQQPGITSWTAGDLASIELPARAAASLLCYEYTPFIEVALQNNTGATHNNAFWLARATLTVRSPVLDDPSLINPVTGRAFDGEFTTTMSSWSENMSLTAGQRLSKGVDYTRRCGQNAISKARLKNVYGLSDAQANAFFNNPVTLILGARGESRLATKLEMQYQVRVYGDRR